MFDHSSIKSPRRKGKKSQKSFEKVWISSNRLGCCLHTSGAFLTRLPCVLFFPFQTQYLKVPYGNRYCWNRMHTVLESILSELTFYIFECRWNIFPSLHFLLTWSLYPLHCLACSPHNGCLCNIQNFLCQSCTDVEGAWGEGSSIKVVLPSGIYA